MCCKMRGTKIVPGSIIMVKRKSGGKSSSIWGFNDGRQYNARSEKLDDSYKNYDRGVIKIDSFWEGKAEFVPSDTDKFSIGVIVNDSNEFAVLTRDSNELVKKYHHRMPILLTEEAEGKFLNGEYGTQLWLPENLIKLKQVA